MPITVVSPRNAASAPSAHDADYPDGGAFRAVPLLISFEDGNGRVVAIGQVRIFAGAGRPAEVKVVVRALWHARTVTDGIRDWEPTDIYDGLAVKVSQQLFPSPVPVFMDPEYAATGGRLTTNTCQHRGGFGHVRPRR